MGLKELVEKYKKPALIASGIAVLFAGALYLVPADEEDE